MYQNRDLPAPYANRHIALKEKTGENDPLLIVNIYKGRNYVCVCVCVRA